MSFPYADKVFLRGDFQVIDRKVIESEDLKIITDLLENYFRNPVSNPDNWDTIYYCDADDSYWILSYEKTEMQGGGIKTLKRVDSNMAKDFIDKYQRE